MGERFSRSTDATKQKGVAGVVRICRLPPHLLVNNYLSLIQRRVSVLFSGRSAQNGMSFIGQLQKRVPNKAHAQANRGYAG